MIRLRGPLAWTALGLLLALLAALGWGRPTEALDWQPDRALAEPWRWFSPVAVHHSGMHLAANGLGLALVVVLGRRAGCDGRAALAWFVAWPLTHLGLLLQPALAHYGGLSGVLHAGVAVAAVHLLACGDGRPWQGRRRLGLLLALGLAAKLIYEAPWRGPVQAVPGWDVAIAPLAHTTGSLAGALCAGLGLLVRRQGAGRSS